MSGRGHRETRRQCAAPDCDRDQVAKGWCLKHYKPDRSDGVTQAVDRGDLGEVPVGVGEEFVDELGVVGLTAAGLRQLSDRDSIHASIVSVDQP